ncbi:MAG: FliI/YscN family ATPase [Pseudomonadota bacterium]
MSAKKEPFKTAALELEDLSPITVRGRVTALSGLVIRAHLLGSRIGDQVRIIRTGLPPLPAETIGFKEQETMLMPLGDPVGVGPDSLVEVIGREMSLHCGSCLLGRVLDGLGKPMDGGPSFSEKELESWPVARSAPDPLQRPRIQRHLSFGLKAIDGLLTIGEGQRIGLFAGSGVGKSTLLGQIARNTEADVCVLCLVGERGREVREFIEENLGNGLSRSVVVCATSDTPPLVRLKSASVATAIAEYFREQSKKVLLLMDSVTRYARALREVSLATGESPARRGYPASVFSQLPRILERTGTSVNGSITAVYTVLVEGSDMEEPITDEVRAALDGHIVLSRELAQRNHWPAIDVLQSLSRVMNAVTDKPHQQAAAKLRELLATFEEHRDLILLGAYKNGTDTKIDTALTKIESINTFLRQQIDECQPFEKTRQGLLGLFG